MKHIVLYILALFVLQTAQAQQQDSIAVKSAVIDGKIILRWAPSGYWAWRAGLAHGYKVERYFIEKGTFGDSVKLTDSGDWLVKPMDMESIKELATSDDDFAALEGAIEGNISEGRSKVDLINEQESRFGMALLLADFSVPLAKAQGLYFRDSLIPDNMMVGYRISVADSSEVKPAYMLLNPDEKTELPIIPYALAAEGKNVALRWDVKFVDEYYVGYYIERSESERSFDRLNKEPFIHIANDDAANDNTLVYKDTLTTVGSHYRYRLVGISPFGIEKICSDTLSVEIADPKVYNVQLQEGVPVGGMIELKWTVPDSVALKVDRWTLFKSDDYAGKFSIAGSTENPLANSIIDRSFSQTSYYKLEGTLQEKRVALSDIIRVMDEDTIPPLAPSGLRGEVLASGQASIVWKKSDEQIKAYNIYRKYNKDEKPYPVTTTQDTVFAEKLQAGLSKKVIYYVEAVDLRFNRSPLSEPLELVMPDTIPPVPAAIRRVEKAEGKVALTLVSSPSNDIDYYELCGCGDSLVVLEKLPAPLTKSCSIPFAKAAPYSSVCLRTYDLSGNISVSECADISPFVEKPVLPLAVVATKRIKGEYKLFISDVCAGVNALKLYISKDGAKYELTKTLPIGTLPMEYNFGKLKDVQSYKIMLVGPLSVKPVMEVVK